MQRRQIVAQLVARHPRDLIAPAAGEQEQLRDRGERSPDRVAGRREPPQFIGAADITPEIEHAVARGPARRDASRRGRGSRPAPGATVANDPLEHRTERVGHLSPARVGRAGVARRDPGGAEPPRLVDDGVDVVPVDLRYWLIVPSIREAVFASVSARRDPEVARPRSRATSRQRRGRWPVRRTLCCSMKSRVAWRTCRRRARRQRRGRGALGRASAAGSRPSKRCLAVSTARRRAAASVSVRRSPARLPPPGR